MKRARSLVAASTVALAAVAGSGCGARTGLLVPDVPYDAPVDAALDVPAPFSICLEPDPTLMEPLIVDLDTVAQVAVADVLFVIDRTGSMGGEIANISQSLRTVIVPGLSRNVPDLQLGLATYADFPVEPYGSPTDVPFSVDQRMSNDYTALQGALSRLTAEGGGDNPEAMIEALFQLGTGDGYEGPTPRSSIAPSPGCPGRGRRVRLRAPALDAHHRAHRRRAVAQRPHDPGLRRGALQPG
jgi:hypothetical protein